MTKQEIIEKYGEAYYKERLKQQKEYYLKNKKKIIARQTAYYKANPDKKKESDKNYRKKHKEELKEKSKIFSKRYYENHKKECNKRNTECRRKRFKNDEEFKNSQIFKLEKWKENLSEEKRNKMKYKSSISSNEKRGNSCIYRMKESEWLNSTTKEKSSHIVRMMMANTNAIKSQFGKRTSKRKGVCQAKNGTWSAYLTKNGIDYRKRGLKTEEEAIAYREFLENKYLDEDQKELKEKLKGELIK